MRTYILPFTEIINGYYIFEAENFEDAKRIVKEGDFSFEADKEYVDGETDYDINDLEEQKCEHPEWRYLHDRQDQCDDYNCGGNAEDCEMKVCIDCGEDV